MFSYFANHRFGKDREQRKQKKQLPCTACRAATDRSEHPASGAIAKSASVGSSTDDLAEAVMTEVSKALLDMKRLYLLPIHVMILHPEWSLLT
eukprot:2979706-Amphidinium_carterae.1